MTVGAHSGSRISGSVEPTGRRRRDRGPAAHAVQPGQDPVPRGRLHESRGRRLLRPDRAGHGPPPRPAGPSPGPRARRGRRASGSSRSAARRHAPTWVRPPSVARARRLRRRRRADARLAREPRRARAPHPAGHASTTPGRPDGGGVRPRPRRARATILDCAGSRSTCATLLDRLGLTSVVKTSGSKGLHLAVPLTTPDVTDDATKAFALALGQLLAERGSGAGHGRDGEGTSAPGKVFVDWSQNDRAQDDVAAYSLRIRPEPTVSTPVTWDEVADALDAGDDERAHVRDRRRARARRPSSATCTPPTSRSSRSSPGWAARPEAAAPGGPTGARHRARYLRILKSFRRDPARAHPHARRRPERSQAPSRCVTTPALPGRDAVAVEPAAGPRRVRHLRRPGGRDAVVGGALPLGRARRHAPVPPRPRRPAGVLLDRRHRTRDHAPPALPHEGRGAARARPLGHGRRRRPAGARPHVRAVLLDATQEFLGPDRAQTLVESYREHKVHVGRPALLDRRATSTTAGTSGCGCSEATRWPSTTAPTSRPRS